MKIGRNDPCPCGSGKKYKRCCLALDEDRARPVLPQPLATPGHSPLCDCCGKEMRAYNYGWVDAAQVDELDELSNQVPELIRAKKLDDAERVANELLERFPDQVDGLESLARVYEARGDLNRAVEYYRKAAAFATVNEGFDPEAVAWYTDAARLLERKLKR